MREETSLLELSGEHPTLPSAEVRAILESAQAPFRIVESAFKTLVMDFEPTHLGLIGSRSGMCDAGARHIFTCGVDFEEILSTARKLDFSWYIDNGDSFQVDVRRAGPNRVEYSRSKLEGHLAGTITRNVPYTRVDLTRPKKTFIGLLSENRFHLGLQAFRRKRGVLSARKPSRRPVFHPSSMPPKLARCMVNLARPREGSLLLDPFCGVGGILIEAGMVGCKVLGLDAQRRMVRGSRRNLRNYQVKYEGLFRGDARHLPVRSVECIATDPPYGTAASTFRSTTRSILEEFLPEAASVLGSGGHICLASPKTVGLQQVIDRAGFEFVERHEVYIHRRLTREIAVAKKP